MKRTSRILCLLLAGILCFTTVSTVRADDISETEEEKKELEEAKKKAEQAKEDLANQLNAIAKEMNQAFNGRGGGKPPMVQGSLKAAKENIEEFLKNR